MVASAKQSVAVSMVSASCTIGSVKDETTEELSRVCLSVCLPVRPSVRLSVCLYACMHLWMYGRVDVWRYVRMHEHMHVCL